MSGHFYVIPLTFLVTKKAQLWGPLFCNDRPFENHRTSRVQLMWGIFKKEVVSHMLLIWGQNHRSSDVKILGCSTTLQQYYSTFSRGSRDKPLVATGILGGGASQYTPQKLTFSHLKMDGWKTILSFWDGSLGRTVSFREGVYTSLP